MFSVRWVRRHRSNLHIQAVREWLVHHLRLAASNVAASTTPTRKMKLVQLLERIDDEVGSYQLTIKDMNELASACVTLPTSSTPTRRKSKRARSAGDEQV